MTTPDPHYLPEIRLNTDRVTSPGIRASADEFGTLLLTSDGLIAGCGTTGCKILGGDEAMLLGRPIANYIANINFKDNRLTNASSLLHHVRPRGAWHIFDAVNIQGDRFEIEACLSTVRAGNEELVLVSLRRREVRQGSREAVSFHA
jgi:hypothetical protein